MLSAWFLNKFPPHTRHVLWEEFSPYISLIPTNDSLSVSVFSSALESLFLHLFNESFGFSTVFFSSPLLLFLSLPRKVFHPSFLDSHVVSHLILVHHMKGGLAAAPPPLCSGGDFLCVLLTGPALSVCLHLAFLVESLICVIAFSGN